MASISVGLPWQSLIAAHLPELQAGFTREHPALPVHLVAGETALAGRVDADGVNPAQAAFALAEFLAPMWPALLGAHGVELVVVCGGSSWSSPPASMARLAEGGVAREAWLGEASFSAD